MDLETVNYSVDGGVARIEMNRPERHNALSYQLLDDLDAAFDAAERDREVRAVVLSGAGRSSSSW
jgi:enoyl-CoA hydratase/carnithine racemase